MSNDSSCVGLAKGKREIYPCSRWTQHRVEYTLQVNCTWLHYLRKLFTIMMMIVFISCIFLWLSDRSEAWRFWRAKIYSSLLFFLCLLVPLSCGNKLLSFVACSTSLSKLLGCWQHCSFEYIQTVGGWTLLSTLNETSLKRVYELVELWVWICYV